MVTTPAIAHIRQSTTLLHLCNTSRYSATFSNCSSSIVQKSALIDGFYVGKRITCMTAVPQKTFCCPEILGFVEMQLMSAVSPPGSQPLPEPLHGAGHPAAHPGSSAAQQRARPAGELRSRPGSAALPLRVASLRRGPEGHLHHPAPDGGRRSGPTRRPALGHQGC